MSRDELRRRHRVKVCCKVDVRDRFGVWTAVTEDLCERGCRLVTTKLPRVGSALALTLSSDLLPESLEVTGEAAWASDNRVGVFFVAQVGAAGARSPAEWVEEIVRLGRILGPEPLGAESVRLAPAIRRPPGPAPVQESAAQETTPRESGGEDGVLWLPVRQR